MDPKAKHTSTSSKILNDHITVLKKQKEISILVPELAWPEP